jgi:hypothetical protein
MTVYKGMTAEIGRPMPEAPGIRNTIDPEGLVAQAAALRETRDRTRLAMAKAFEAREHAGSVEQRMAAALKVNRSTARRP